MKQEIQRIMQLVKDGKLSPEDAAELIEAFQEAPNEDLDPDPTTQSQTYQEQTTAQTTNHDSSQTKQSKSDNDPFAKLVESIEKITKDVSKNVDWKSVAGSVREGVSKGVEAIKSAAEEAAKGKGPFGAVFGSQIHRTVELPLHIPQHKVFRIEGHAGDVRIEGGYPVGSVKIEASFKAYSDEEARAIADRYTPILEESEDAVTLRQPDPEGTIADVTVKLPTGTPVVAKLASGDFETTATQASVKLESASGDTRVREAKGVVEIRTASGDVKISQSAAAVTVETKSGDVILDHVDGSANLRTSSGDITLYNHKGRTLAVDAASGSITADLLEPVEGSLAIRTVSGDITLHLPDGSDARVNISTLRGTVECKLPLQDAAIEHAKAQGRLGSGNGTFDVSAVNGDIFVALRDATAHPPQQPQEPQTPQQPQEPGQPQAPGENNNPA